MMALAKIVGLEVAPVTASSETRAANAPLSRRSRERSSSQIETPACCSACRRSMSRSGVPSAQRRVVVDGEAGEGERGEQQAEVAQCDVVPAREGEQVEDDAREPGGDERRAVARLECDGQAGEDLDDP